MRYTRRIAQLVGVACVILAAACEKITIPETKPATPDEMIPGMIYFSNPKISTSVETRVTDTEQSDGSYTSKFDDNDEISVYSFYNYYYEPDGESVVFDNEKVTVADDDTTAEYQELTYGEPLRAWTFSTIYGTAPHTVQNFAFYPYSTEISLSTTNGSDAATFTLAYDPKEPCDLMVAKTTLSKSTPSDFRDFILGEGEYISDGAQTIKFQFERLLGAITFRITKVARVTEKIEINNIEVFYNTNGKEILTIDTHSMNDTDDGTNSYSWTDSDSITDSSSVKVPVRGENCTINKTPTEIRDEVKTITEKPQFFFTPGTTISKVVFTYTLGSTAGETHTWHPHINPIEANENISLQFELDPGRNN